MMTNRVGKSGIATVILSARFTGNPPVTMKPLYVKITLGYGLWSLLPILITVFRTHDATLGPQLALLITGFPASLISLLCTLDGSLFAVVLTALLGLGQWLGLAYWLKKRND